MNATHPKPLRCESANHPVGEPREGCARCIYACPYCGKTFCAGCEGAALDDGLDDACDDCWMAMDMILGALRGEPWNGEDGDPDNGRSVTGRIQP